jgi:TrmH family RNA methyltransferase
MDNCRVVLVRSKFAGNIGATARVMRNLGLSQLVLVAPEANRDDRQARQMSTHGESILDAARIVSSLDEAVADCGLVVSTSARYGGLVRKHPVLPEEIMPEVVTVMETSPTALVFGPESSGLSDAEITRCHALLHIPADPTYPALNLAQAVAICLYELRRAWLRRIPAEKVPELPAPFAMQDRMFTRLRSALEAIHFLYGPHADSLMHALRHLLGRARPTQTEVDILFGLARQIQWYVEQKAHGTPPVGLEDHPGASQVR